MDKSINFVNKLRYAKQISSQLSPFLPDNTVSYLAELIVKYDVDFLVSKPRKTKLGDYRSPQKGERHRISVNGDLNKYAFLVTSIHEFAHLVAHCDHGRGISPHGKEWKSVFRVLFAPLLEKEIFPEDIQLAVENYLINARASSHSDERLIRVLKRYDKKNSLLVESLEIGEKFKLKNKIFVKGKRLRKYHVCVEVSSGRKYKVFGLAEIELMDE